MAVSELSLVKGTDVSKTLGTSFNLHQILEEIDILTILDTFNKASGQCLNSQALRDLLYKKNDIIFEDLEYESIFNKIDINSTGTVTWDDFISFLILGYEQAAISAEFKSLESPIPCKPNIKKSFHRPYVIRILFNPTLFPDRSINWSEGSYMTLSKDGIINYWSLDMEIQDTVQSTNPDLKVTQTWVTDMVAMPDVNVVCTSSSERDLRFYDSTARKFQLRIRITSFNYAVSTMYYYYPDSNLLPSRLIMGDLGGNIIMFSIETKNRGPFMGILGCPLLQCRFDHVRHGHFEGFQTIIYPKVHTDFVRQVYYYKSLHSIVSCAACPVTPVAVIDYTKNQYTPNLKAYPISGGAWCFHVLESVHLIGTGGPDGLVRVWNPFMSTRPTAIFYRHHTGIIQITFQDEGKLMYTLSKDKNIKVWDVQAQQMIQNYIDIPSPLGDKEFVTFYNPSSRQWIIGGAKLAILPLSPKMSSEHTDGDTHSGGVSCVLYNNLFKLIVTVGIDSIILVWDPWDGRRMLTVKDAHVTIMNGLAIPVEITAACFSQNYHFLLTAAHDGTIKIWDFHNGTCLRNLKLKKNTEICKVFWVGTRILAMGWNRRITEFNSKGEAIGTGRAYSKNWDLRHKGDISSAAIRIPQTLVTADFDGSIVMWKLETGQPYKKYNVSAPTVRIKIDYKLPKHRTSIVVDDEAIDGKSTNLLTRFVPKRMSTFSLDGRSHDHHDHHERKAAKMSMVPVPKELVSLRVLAVHCMIFLNKREMDPEVGTLLVSLGNGTIQIWSHDTLGAFITSFSSIHKAGDYVLSMATDEDNEFLFTGHCSGYIKTWLLLDLCVKNPPHICLPKYRLRFPYMWTGIIRGSACRNLTPLDRPILLNSYKGHFLPISSLEYIDEARMLISGSSDRSARLWTLSGRFLQTIGSFKGWKKLPYAQPVIEGEFEFTVPADLKRILSSTSFRVLSGGFLERKMTKKQIKGRAEKERAAIDPGKIYGKGINKPILGHYYQLPERVTIYRDVQFDCSLPHIPVYTHLKTPEVKEVSLSEKKVISIPEQP
ncbi:unnamed protein product [Brassicogethes aeneus]|uniref:WD repeat-containing protein on Y chromosome n=1 Tax=Brassicogethes aeneus TaxID=1431903 RepID=A0A9P0B0D0_BRAAE|nr:unnamed protein product [Brassicogethes aeneus]